MQDTVIDAGKYDGTLGVVTSIAAVKALLQGGRTAPLLKRPIELVAFCDEEGVRFGSTFLGSRYGVFFALSSFRLPVVRAGTRNFGTVKS